MLPCQSLGKIRRQRSLAMLWLHAAKLIMWQSKRVYAKSPSLQSSRAIITTWMGVTELTNKYHIMVLMILTWLIAVPHRSRQTATPRLPFVFLCIVSSTDPSVLRSFSGFQCLWRKTKKWYKEIFTWILEVAQVNSHILHTLSRPEGTKPLPLAAYKNLLVDQLILVGAPNVMPALLAAAPTPPAKPGRKSVNPAEERLSGNRHLVDHDGLDRQCVYCSLMNKKKKSTYYCSGCEGRPHLCPKECFRKYHTDRVL